MGKLGYYLPWAFSSGVVTTVGYGLISTFSPTTSVGKWIGFQIVAGAGRGFGMQTVSAAYASGSIMERDC